MSKISLMLSPVKLEHQNLQDLGAEAGIYLHKVVSRMGESLQILIPSPGNVSDAIQIADPRLFRNYTPSKTLDQGDLLEFDVPYTAPSVLVLSQKFHPDWHAQTLTKASWQVAPTREVNGVFQGVLLPEDTQRVRLEFKPFARYAWIAHVFWLLLLALLGGTAWRKSRNGDLEKA